MSGDDIGNLIYLMVMLVVIGGYFLVWNNQNLSETLRNAALWVLIFVAAIIGAALWPTLQQALSPGAIISASGDEITLPRGPDGHFYLELEINGTPVEFVVDTGATDVVLSLQDAARIGFAPEDLDFIGRAFTANGEVRTAPVILDDVRLGEFRERRLPASVNEGDLGTSLLGMAYLERFSRIEIAGERLRLER